MEHRQVLGAGNAQHRILQSAQVDIDRAAVVVGQFRTSHMEVRAELAHRDDTATGDLDVFHRGTGHRFDAAETARGVRPAVGAGEVHHCAGTERHRQPGAGLVVQ